MMAFQQTSPEDVRAESMTYQILVLQIFSRMNVLIPEVMKDDQKWESWFAIEASVMYADAILAPYYDDEYNKRKEFLIKKLDEHRGKSQVLYMRAISAWVQEIVRRFGQVNILPPIKVTKIFDPFEYEPDKVY